MRKDILIIVNSENNKVKIDNKTLGITSENLQGKIIFKPEPFVDGVCRLYVDGKGSILMDRQEDCYTVNILSSLLTEDSLDVCFKITEPETEDGIPIFCSKIMHFRVLETIDSSSTIPEDYPSWEQVLDSMMAKVEQMESDAEDRLDEVVGQIQDLTSAYNSNATNKTNAFNTNATNKTNAFNQNYASKVTEIDGAVNSAKTELDDYTEDKKDEIDGSIDDLKAELDTYETAKEGELDTYTNTKKTELNTYTNSKKSDLDDYEETKETALNTLAGNLTSAFNNNATSKTGDFNTNATSKISAYDENASTKLGAYNTNHTTKLAEYNTNATTKTSEFDQNASDKTDDFDDNASAKTTAFNNNATAKIAEYDAHVSELQSQVDDLTTLVETELESNEVEGTEIDVSDSAEYRGPVMPGANLEQEQLSGKNLLNLPNGTYSSNGITAVVQDGKITLNGTATTTSFLAIPFVHEYDGSTYSISANNEDTIGDTTGSGDFASVRISGVTTTQAILGNKNVTKTFTLSGTKNDFTIRTGAGLTYNNFVIYPQLEIGQPTSYEPYCGGQASPNPDYPQSIKVVTGDNVVKHVGKNLLNLTSITENTSSQSANLEKGLITISWDAGFNLDLSDIISNLDSSKIYTISFKHKGDALYLRNKKDNSTNILGTNVDSNYTTYSLNLTNINEFQFRFVRKSNTGTAYIRDIQIEQGSTATPYEPYREEEYKLDLWKENEFDSENATVMNALLNDGGIISAVASYRTVVVSTLPDTLYKISKNSGAFFRIADFANLPQTNDEYISRIKDDNAQFILFKTSHFANYLAITYWNIADTISEQEMLESIKIQQPLELCKIGDYEDILFKNVVGDENYNAELEDGAWYKKSAIAEVVLDGRETWNYNSGNRYFFTNKFLDNYVTQYTKLVSNNYIGGMASKGGLYNNHIQTGTAYSFMICDNRFTDKNDLKTWLSTHNTIVKYPLATPTYEKITDSTLISQLEALRKAKWFKGVNHFWTETENLEPVLKGTYKQSNNIKNKERDERLDNLESRLALLE